MLACSYLPQREFVQEIQGRRVTDFIKKKKGRKIGCLGRCSEWAGEQQPQMYLSGVLLGGGWGGGYWVICGCAKG